MMCAKFRQPDRFFRVVQSHSNRQEPFRIHLVTQLSRFHSLATVYSVLRPFLTDGMRRPLARRDAAHAPKLSTSSKAQEIRKPAAKKVVSRGGAKEFADLVDNDAKVRAQVRRAAAGILLVAKKHGFKVKGEEMQEELRRRFKVKANPKSPDADGPMTCWCFSETPGF